MMSNEQPMMNDEQSMMNSEQLVMSNVQLMISNKQPIMNSEHQGKSTTNYYYTMIDCDQPSASKQESKQPMLDTKKKQFLISLKN